MKINLRKAHAIQSEIRRAISEIEIQKTVDLTEFTAQDSIQPLIVGAANTVVENINRKAALIDALYNIRASVTAANIQAGIDRVLNEINSIEEKIQMYKQIIEQRQFMELDEVGARVEKLKARPTSTTPSHMFGALTTVSVPVLTKAYVDSINELVVSSKRLKRTLEDKLLEINVGTLIELAAADSVTLVKEGII